MLSRAHRNFHTNWTAILLAVISIIQGLAFNDIASRLQTVLVYTIETRDLIPAAHFVLAFTLLLRIFQTYVTAALDYDEWSTSFADVLLIFVVGLLEYHVFSSLVVPGFVVTRFHARISIVSALALVGYSRAFASLEESMFPTHEAYRSERRLQAVNIGGVAMVLAMSILVLRVHALPHAVYVLIGLLSAVVLAFNMGYSMQATFHSKVDIAEAEDKDFPELATGAHPVCGDLKIRQARRSDVLALRRLLMENFGYIYCAAFDTSPRMTEKVLLSFLCTAGGRIPNFGFRSFQVACTGEPSEVVGLLKLTTRSSANERKAYWFLLPAIIVRHLGFVGLLRTWQNWRVLSDTVPNVDREELYVQYIAVSSRYQGAGVGAGLLDYAAKLCADLRKSNVVLDVREPNQKARAFFRSHGFRERLLIRRRSDELLDKGSTIRMERTL